MKSLRSATRFGALFGRVALGLLWLASGSLAAAGEPGSQQDSARRPAPPPITSQPPLTVKVASPAGSVVQVTRLPDAAGPHAGIPEGRPKRVGPGWEPVGRRATDHRLREGEAPAEPNTGTHAPSTGTHAPSTGTHAPSTGRANGALKFQPTQPLLQPVSHFQPAAQPPGGPVLPPAPGGADLPPAEGIQRTPHFEVIDSGSNELTVTVRRSKLLRTQHDIYRTAVVDPAICDIVQFTPREVSLIGKGVGATTVTFWFKDGQHRAVSYLVKVVPDPQERRNVEQQYRLLEDVLAELFPDSKVRLVHVADKLIVKGQAKGAEEAAQILAIIRGEAASNSRGSRFGRIAEGAAADVLSVDETGRRRQPRIEVINMLRVPGVQQVALRVKIAELNRSAARGFGVNLGGRIDFGNGESGSNLLLQSMLNLATGGANGTSLLFNFDGDDIQVGIRWLQQHGVVRLLSEPTLVTLSGRPATFVAGGEFAVPTVVGVGGAAAATTDFRSFGVIISFLPVVIDKDRIRLEVSPEFSQINNGLDVNDIPGLNVRAVTTTVEMREGQTLAIAGLLDDSMTATKTSDLPWIGHILGRRDVTRNETELIILVTPELVHPMEPEEVPPLPGFDVTEPTDCQFYYHGRIEGDPTLEHRSTIWPRLRSRYRAGGSAMISGPFGHGQ